MIFFTALHPNSELNDYFIKDGTRSALDIKPYYVHTNLIEDIYPNAVYDRVKFFEMPSASETDSEGRPKIISGSELVQIIGGYMAGNYQGALECSQSQARWLLASDDFKVFRYGTDIERLELISRLTGAV